MSKGVLVDTWYYAHKAVDGDQGEGMDDEAPGQAPKVAERKVEIKVRLLKETREADAAPHITSGVSFEATCREFDVRVVGTDIEAIRKAVFSRLDETLAIRWDEHFLVHVERPHIWEGTGSGALVRWTTVWKGEAWDGSLLMREFDFHRSSSSTWRISPWPGAFSQKNGRVMACIPCTEKNRAGLEEFAAKLDQLRKLLAGFLSPEHIQATLANLAGVAFLPAPDGEGEGQGNEENEP